MRKEFVIKKIMTFVVYAGAFGAIGLILFAGFSYFYDFKKSSDKLEETFLKTIANQESLSNYLYQVQELKSLYSHPFYSHPVFKFECAPLSLGAKSAISFLIKNDGSEKILYQKNKSQKLPIASISKLMTAYIVLKYYEPDKIITFTNEALDPYYGRVGGYSWGEKFKAKDLLYSILMESSNTAAWALVHSIGAQKFINLMNEEAKNLELFSTVFVEPTGLALKHATTTSNESTADDVAKLGRYLIKENSPILEISATEKFELYRANGVFHHKVSNTNALFKKNNIKIMGGKTGFTLLAGRCLFLIIEAPEKQGFIINVILGADDHFEEMKQLIGWTETCYDWETDLRD